MVSLRGTCPFVWVEGIYGACETGGIAIPGERQSGGGQTKHRRGIGTMCVHDVRTWLGVSRRDGKACVWRRPRQMAKMGKFGRLWGHWHRRRQTPGQLCLASMKICEWAKRCPVFHSNFKTNSWHTTFTTKENTCIAAVLAVAQRISYSCLLLGFCLTWSYMNRLSELGSD